MFSAQTKAQEIVDVYKSGEEGYACFRIPAIIKAQDGTFLAFAEGRRKSASDTGNIDLVLKRSKDGKVWSPLQVVWTDSGNTCGNPAPVVDKRTGRIVLLSTWNDGSDTESKIVKKTSRDTRRVFVMTSDDVGVSWTSPREITSSVKKESWTWYATGPCHAIQLQGKSYRNRLVIPSNHDESNNHYSQVFYSDDGGNSWQLGGVIPQTGVNECSVVELKNGDLMLNMRNYDRKAFKARAVAVSHDGGASWSDFHFQQEQIEPICQGNVLNLLKHGKVSKNLFFSNPASESERIKMTVRQSRDNGKSWPHSFEVYSGPSAYSDLVAISDKEVGVLFEYGLKNPYERIGFMPVSVKQLR